MLRSGVAAQSTPPHRRKLLLRSRRSLRVCCDGSIGKNGVRPRSSSFCDRCGTVLALTREQSRVDVSNGYSLASRAAIWYPLATLMFYSWLLQQSGITTLDVCLSRLEIFGALECTRRLAQLHRQSRFLKWPAASFHSMTEIRVGGAGCHRVLIITCCSCMISLLACARVVQWWCTTGAHLARRGIAIGGLAG